MTVGCDNPRCFLPYINKTNYVCLCCRYCLRAKEIKEELEKEKIENGRS